MSENVSIKENQNTLGEFNKHGEYIKIGGCPIAGVNLSYILRGHSQPIFSIAWSPDGKFIASPSRDRTIRVWDMEKGDCKLILKGHTSEVNAVTWSPSGKEIASVSEDGSIFFWNAINGKAIYTIIDNGSAIYGTAWSPNGKNLASASKNGSVKLWDTTKHKHIKTFTGHTAPADGLAWSPNGHHLASTSFDHTIRLWGIRKEVPTRLLTGHEQDVTSVLWSLDGKKIISASCDQTILVWDARSGKILKSLEGHSSAVNSICFSYNSHLLASKSQDKTIRLWKNDTWDCLASFDESCFGGTASKIAFHPHLPILATLGEKDTIIRIWELDEDLLLSQAQQNINYTTAKLVLVGDSGVGKTGLGWRMAHNEFKEHASTHGQQFWPIQQLNLKRNDGTDCEAVLWDLAGQHIYRQVHSIFLENVAAALVLFDPTNRQDPLKGAKFWLEQLKGKGKLPPTVLVGARVDRGSPALSQDELDQFCQQYGIKGGYLSTSAKAGDGLPELLDILKEQIPWDDMTATVTTVTFKRIKDYVLSLKEKTDRKGVLVSPAELRELLEEAPTDDDTAEEWNFTDAEMMTAVGHLDTHGYVAVLCDSAGEETILLTPDLLVNLAASIMLLADKNPHELGAVSETELLQGKYDFDELKGLAESEKQTLLDAAVLRFLEHNICFRDTFNDDTLLIFPSLIKQKRPLQDDVPTTDDISYVVRGRVENLYASLVVLLGHTPTFSRLHQWQNQAQYEMREGGICGFRAIEEREGELEMVLYYGDDMAPQGREKFHELFEQFLYQREVEVTPYPPITCANSHQIERATVVKRTRENKNFVFCDECGDKVILPDFDAPQTIGIDASPWLQREEALARLRSTYEKNLTNIKSYRRGWATPRAYLSYLPEQSAWVEIFAHDLRDAGVYIIENSADLAADDYVIVLDTPAYQRAYEASPSTPMMQVVRERLNNGSRKILSLSCAGRMDEHRFEDCTAGDFSGKTHYAVSLFNLVMELYAIPLNHKGFEPLRKGLHQQWESTLAGKDGMEAETAPTFKIFISYSHRDEAFKDDFLTFIKPLERQGILEIWHDRKIEEGDEWKAEIEKAMIECDLALLFVSKSFLASEFINDEELPQLFQRRKDEGLRVVPIIVRQCMWQEEPTLKEIQALPRDNKPIVSFSDDNGERDEIWTAISQEIKKRAVEK